MPTETELFDLISALLEVESEIAYCEGRIAELTPEKATIENEIADCEDILFGSGSMSSYPEVQDINKAMAAYGNGVTCRLVQLYCNRMPLPEKS